MADLERHTATSGTALHSMRTVVIAGAALIVLFFGALGGWAAVAPLSRALEIATALAAEGRLAPADAWMVEDLQMRLAAVRDGS